MQHVEILLATYNGENYISDQLISLFDQTHKNLTITICDDGSTDQTIKILNTFIEKTPRLIRLVEKPKGKDKGAKHTFESLLKNSIGDYIMFCDQDDVWKPNKIKDTLEAMNAAEQLHGNKTPLLVHCDLTIADQNLRTLSESFVRSQKIKKEPKFKDLLIKNSVTGCGMMINSAAAKGLKYIPPEAIMHDWWIALYVSAFGKIYFIDKSLIIYRQHKNNTIGAKKRGIAYIYHQLKKFINSCIKKYSLLDKYAIQSNSFLQQYRSELSPERLHDIQLFLKIFNSKTPIKRILALIKSKTSKQGFFDNLGLIILIGIHRTGPKNDK